MRQALLPFSEILYKVCRMFSKMSPRKVLLGLSFLVIISIAVITNCFLDVSYPEEPLIIAVTPTYKRAERLAEMTRLSQTLRHVKNLHWLVIEDGNLTVDAVRRILERSGIPFTYLGTVRESGLPHRGLTQLNFALSYLRENFTTDREAIVYFCEDDNTYDLRLFDNYIRKVKRIGLWAVGLVGEEYVEAPVVENGIIVGWNAEFKPNRTFATVMGGFALNLQEIRKTDAGFTEKCTANSIDRPENCFLEQFEFRKEDLEPFGYNDYPKEVLVWHTESVPMLEQGDDGLHMLRN